MPEPLTSIDLFCGCGGFTLGLKQAGLTTLAAIDFAPDAIAVFKANFPEVPVVLERDLTAFPPEDLAAMIGRERVDVVVGGPPCQGFSNVRRRDGMNHGQHIVPDERRELYKQFLAYVAFFRPSVFVMENVQGIRSADKGRHFASVQSDARDMGYRVYGQTVRAADFGVPQKRVRQLIIGTQVELPVFRPAMLRPTRVDNPVTLGEAICDLPPLKAGEGADHASYDLDLRRKHAEVYGNQFLYGVLKVTKAKALTAHWARPHSQRDLRDFARLREGENSKHAMMRGVKFEFPYAKDCFRDRYTRQSRDGLCSTIVAHLAKDGLMFIHPTQCRTLTPREAARIQTFPDWFVFPVARSHQYRVVGNAVPPLVAKAIGKAVQRYLSKAADAPDLCRGRASRYVPASPDEAAERLLVLLEHSNPTSLVHLAPQSFLAGWYAIFYLMPGLHPDSVPQRSFEVVTETVQVPCDVPDSLCESLRVADAATGWPIALIPILRNAWRRYKCGDLKEHEFYCVGAQMAGLGIVPETAIA
jgi:DNA (cytosine-5)-methyltransferase 1